MKLVVAIIQPTRLKAVQAALEKLGQHAGPYATLLDLLGNGAKPNFTVGCNTNPI